MYSDATAAIGMVKRLGLGRVRHLAVADLWIQQRLRKGDFFVHKVPGKENPSDAYTKTRSREHNEYLMGKLGFYYLGGRAAVAPSRTKSGAAAGQQPYRSESGGT